MTLLAPVRPGRFIGLWNNFRALAEKQGNAIPEGPLYFLKSPGSIIGPGAPIRTPAGYTGKVLYEGELGLVIGERVSNADEAEAAAAIFGLTCVNDVTALDILTADPSFPQWARAKSPDGFGPVGPCIATGLDWRSLTVKVALNGRVRQDYPCSDMILPPARIVSADLARDDAGAGGPDRRRHLAGRAADAAGDGGRGDDRGDRHPGQSLRSAAGVAPERRA